MKAEVIAIANHKGGVGKSFTAVNLAAGLARGGMAHPAGGLRPQGNSTSMFDPDDDVEYDIYDLVKDEVPLTKVIRQTRIDNLDLVPSTLAVAKLDQELVTMHRREDQITIALDPPTATTTPWCWICPRTSDSSSSLHSMPRNG